MVWTDRGSDLGGETFAGITRKNWWKETKELWAAIDACKGYSDFPSVLERPAMQEKLAPLVEAFYRTYFWDAANLGLLEDQDIANEVYDTGVNCGANPAVRFLQEGVWALNFGTNIPTPIVDGNLGPKTAASVNALCKNTQMKKALLVDLNIRQGVWYQAIIRRNPAQRANYRGWVINRIGEDL